MRQPPDLNSMTAPETDPEPAYPGSPANYLELYGLSKPPFSGAAAGGGYILFGSRKRGFDVLVDHITNGTGLLLLQGGEGSGKTETLRSAAALVEASDLAVVMVSRPPDGSISLTRLIAALTGDPDPDETVVNQAITDQPMTDQEVADQAIDRFLSAPRKVLLADDIDLMPNECVRLLRSLAQRIPDVPNGAAIVLTSSTDLSDISKRPDLSSFVTLTRKTIRLMSLRPAEVRQYIERSLWVSGGTTRRLLSSDAIRLLIKRSDGMPGSINALMEGALMAGFARGDPIITAKTMGGTIAPAVPRRANRMNAPSGSAALVLQIVAAGLLLTGVSVFLYKGLDGELRQPRPGTPPEVLAPAGLPPAAIVPAPQPPPAAKQAEPASPELIAALMKRGDQSLELGDIAAARLLFQRAAEAGNAAAATALAKTYDPNYMAPGGKPDPVRAADWYRKAIGLGDTRATDLLKRLVTR